MRQRGDWWIDKNCEGSSHGLFRHTIQSSSWNSY
jgi:hypothetical protein